MVNCLLHEIRTSQTWAIHMFDSAHAKTIIQCSPHRSLWRHHRSASSDKKSFLMSLSPYAQAILACEYWPSINRNGVSKETVSARSGTLPEAQQVCKTKGMLHAVELSSRVKQCRDLLNSRKVEMTTCASWYRNVKISCKRRLWKGEGLSSPP